MKYFIKRKKLPYSEDHHNYTLTICLGIVQSETGGYEAKVQIPVESYREGLFLYRRFLQEQKEYFGNGQGNELTPHQQPEEIDDQQAIALN